MTIDEKVMLSYFTQTQAAALAVVMASVLSDINDIDQLTATPEEIERLMTTKKVLQALDLAARESIAENDGMVTWHIANATREMRAVL